MRVSLEVSLRALVENGMLARSNCSAALEKFIAPLLAARVLEWERAGAGQRLAVRNRASLQQFISQEFPFSAAEFSGDSSRIEGVARFRDSKAIGNNAPEIICLRAWQEGGLHCGGDPIPISAATERFGLFSFLLDDPARYSLRGRWAFVENPALFGRFEQLGIVAEGVVFGRGRCSSRMIDWLGKQKNLELLHLPDYDPVGLSEYERLKVRLQERVELYLPETLPLLFSKFSNPAVLANSTAQALLANLRRSQFAEVVKVASLIDRHNAGLEQEALLIASL